MSSRELSDQEEFWKGQFGLAYTDRNSTADYFADNAQALSIEIKSMKRPITRALELGANRGLNIEALKFLLPKTEFTAVEINAYAAEILEKTGARVFNQSMIDFVPKEKYDLVLIRGVLIHLNPELLSKAYEVIAEAGSKYVLISEYYNPVPVAVEYRGEVNRLFKRDFAGEFMKAHNEFKLLDYGFHYHGGSYQGDDQTWFLLQRNPVS
jgi:pseudaminic acid biosynthesis-associated methylase